MYHLFTKVSSLWLYMGSFINICVSVRVFIQDNTGACMLLQKCFFRCYLMLLALNLWTGIFFTVQLVIEAREAWWTRVQSEEIIKFQWFKLMLTILNSLGSKPNFVINFLHLKIRQTFEWVKSLSRVWLFATLWTVAYQASLSMGFSRQEYWSGLSFPSPGDLPNPGIEPGSPSLEADALTSEPPGKPRFNMPIFFFLV